MLQAEKLTIHQLPLINNLLSQSPAQLRKKIQHYSFSLTDKIGKGFSSVVYRGRNDLTNQTVAIKVIELKSLRDDITRNLLQTELQCMKKINHVNLLKCFDSYRTVNNCYIVTEYCEGGDLEKYLRIKGRFSQTQFIRFYSQFYAGYQSFLSAGYIHRDIKPANIFIKGDQIKIADFGMVKKLTQNPRDNYNVGTPVYMPPQSLLSNIYTQKSDVWAVGVMCYQLTHGILPWRGFTQQQLKINIQNTRVCFDYNLISLDLIKFISQCLDKNPNTRMSIAEMFGQPWMLKNVVPLLDTMAAVKHDNNKVNMSLNGNNSMHTNLQVTPYIQLNTPTMTTIAKQPSIQLVSDRTPIFTVTTQNRNLTTQKSSSLSHHKNHNSSSKNSITINNISNANLTSLQAVPSIQFLQVKQLSQNINIMNRPLKSQRQTMDSDTLPQNIKRKVSFLQGNQKAPIRQSKKSPLDYLIAILNYLRYLYKIYKLVSQSKNSYINQQIKGTIKLCLARQLIKCLNNQQKMIRNKDNVYGLMSWDEFVSSNKWDTYVHVVQQYSHKYRTLKEQYQKRQSSQQHHTKGRISPQLRTSIQHLHNKLKYPSTTISATNKQNQQNAQIFSLLQILDYLVTIYNLEDVIFCFGWIKFVEKSPINDIVQCRCLVNRNNYESTRQKIQKQVNRISIST